MKFRIDPPPDLLTLAQMQDGVLTAEQAAAFGLRRHSIARLVGQGRWSALDSGLYAIDGAQDDWRAKAWGGVLLGGDAARIGGTSAAHLHGLLVDPPAEITVLVPHTVRRRNRPPWRFQRERPGAHDRRSVGGPPRLTIEDTVLDLCDPKLTPSSRSPTDWVMTAVQQRKTTPRRLQSALDLRSRSINRRLIQDMITDVAVGAQSALEVRYLHDVERAHGLPHGRRQSGRATGRAERTRRAYRDVLYEEYAVVVELDGRPGHDDEGRFRDLRRDNVSAVRGELTLRYGWEDVVDDTCLTAFQVGGVLLRRGWPGPIQQCPNCAGVPWLGETAAG